MSAMRNRVGTDAPLPRDAPDVAEYAIRVLESIDTVSARDWDALLDADSYCNHAYLSALARSHLPCRILYAVAEHRGTLVGFAFGYVTAFPLFAKLAAPVFIGGSPVNIGRPFACASTAPVSALFASLQRALYESARAAAHFMVLRDYRDNDELINSSGIVRGLRLVHMPLHACGVLKLNWPDFEAYLASLRATFRKAIRRDIREVEAQGFELTIVPGGDIDGIETLLPLWQNVCRKYNDQDQIQLTPEYFLEMARQPHVRFFFLRRAGRIIAFDLCFALGSTLESVYSGIDYVATGELPVHRYLGHEITRYAIAHGFQSINFGISNEKTKQRAGCDLVMLNAYVRPMSGAFNALGGGRLMKYLFGGARAEPMDVFRSDEARAGTGAAVSSLDAETVIIGGGIAGLAAAAMLTQGGGKTTVYEANTLAGGLCTTRTFDRVGGHVIGCNLFSRRFFQVLERELGLRLPHRRARILTYYRGATFDSDGSVLNTVRGLRRLGVGYRDLMVAGLRVAAFVLWPHRRRYRSYLDVIRSALPSEVLCDLAAAPASLLGVPPQHLPASKLRELLRYGAPYYPAAGIQSIPQAIVRKIEKSNLGRVVLSGRVEHIVVDEDRVCGVSVDGRFIPARTVISSLSEENTRALLAPRQDIPCEAAAPHSGLAVGAILLRLRPNPPLPWGYHSFSFLFSDMTGRLEQLDAGVWPMPFSFELIAPDLVDAKRRGQEVRATVYFNWPRQAQNIDAAELAWGHIEAVLESHFPAFTQAVVWRKTLSPEDYIKELGIASVAVPSIAALHRDVTRREAGRIEGLVLTEDYLNGGGDGLAALVSGIHSALAIKRANNSSTVSNANTLQR